jgi:hypothetical protein
MMAARQRQIGGKLQGPLGAHEVALKVGAEGIAAPSHAGDAQAGFAEQRIVDGD